MLLNFLVFNLFIHIIIFAWKRHENTNFFYKLSVASLFIALIMGGLDLYHAEPTYTLLYNGVLRSHRLLLSQQFFIILITFILILIYREYKFKPEFYLLIFTNIFAMCVILESFNFVIFFIGWEIFNLSLYALIIGNNVRTQEALSASMKYFILSAFSTAFLLLGLAILYHTTGTLQFEPIFMNLEHNPIDLAAVFIIFALLFKLSASPLHFWAPDLYSVTPLPITAYISNVPKVFYIFIVIVLMDFLDCQSNYFLIAGFLSLIIGTIGLTQQTKIKRFLAFSAIANVGYLLLIIQYDPIVIYNLVLYIFPALNIFIILIAANKFYDKDIDNIQDLRGFFSFNPFMALSFAISIFSIAGIPPLPGYYAKFHLFVQSFYIYHPALFIIIVITSVIAVANYLRILYVALFSPYTQYKFKGSQSYTVFYVVIILNFIIVGLLTYLDLLTIFIQFIGFKFGI